MSEDFDKSWLAVKEAKQGRGRPFLYSDTGMRLMLTLRHLFKLALRQLTGFIESLFTLIGKSLPVPEFSRLSKRASASLSKLSLPSLKEPGHIIIDSTGLKEKNGWKLNMANSINVKYGGSSILVLMEKGS